MRHNNLFLARLSRRWILPTILVVGAVVFYILFPETVLFYDGDLGAQRPIMSAEFVAYVVAYALTLAFLPRFYLWETLGGRRIQKAVVIRVLVVLVVPALLYMVIRIPDSMMPSDLTTSVLVGNVIVVSSLLLITLGSFGSIFGTISFVGIMWFLLEMQVRDVSLEWLPLTWTGNYFAGEHFFDATWKIPWIIALPIIAFLLSWRTRLVPIHLRFRL